MKNTFTIRAAKREDIAAIASIAEATELFPADMTPDMIAPFFGNSDNADIWLVAEHTDGIAGFTFCEPERMTVGTANMLAIGVKPALQGQEVGSMLTQHLEGLLKERGDRLLLVETLGLPEFDRTRQFYLGHGFEQEAVIRDFYDAGEDKIVFRKTL